MPTFIVGTAFRPCPPWWLPLFYISIFTNCNIFENTKTSSEFNKKNNFDFLRLLFAVFVLITHAYPLSGVVECDVLCQLTDGKISFSLIGVKGFFVISGYLVFQSLLRSKNLFSYFGKRVLRVFPALFIVQIITIIVAYFVYEGEGNFWQNQSVQTYISNKLSLYFEQLNIEGVFATNPYKSTVNGSLWTIRYEFTLYILLAFLYFLRNNRKALQVVMVTFFIIGLVGYHFFIGKFYKVNFGVINLGSLLDFSIYFGAGAVMQVLGIDTLRNKPLALLICFVLFCFGITFFNNEILFFILFPIVIILIGLNPIKHVTSVGQHIGDWSYGIYIYGFLVQQTLMYCFNLSYWQLMNTSIPISCLLGFLSWHLLEKRALMLKRRL